MSAEFDFIVVGSGAGGGPLACRLAQASEGYKVALLDAGVDPTITDNGSENFNYSVPALHGRATEDRRLSWDFFVRHYSDDARQSQDTKLHPPASGPAELDPRRRGVWYPRAGTLGGCTAHNAMITVYPHNEDWDHIQELTGDASWSSDNMRQYFEHLEDCRYAPLQPNLGRHGFANWLSTSLVDVSVLYAALKDRSVLAIAVAAVKTMIEETILQRKQLPTEDQIRAGLARVGIFLDQMDVSSERMTAAQRSLVEKLKTVLSSDAALTHIKSLLPLFFPDIVQFHLESLGQHAAGLLHRPATDALIDRVLQHLLAGVSLSELVDLLLQHVDPNDWRIVQAGLEGVFPIPLATDGARRSGPRDLIQATLDNCPYRLSVMTSVLVTRIIFDGTRAVGVRYVKSDHPYFASARNRDRLSSPPPSLPEEHELRVRREVILSGGTFNTPQLLMLSGVGPEEVLKKWQISPVGQRYWPGVGKNLQDRYELGVISTMAQDFELLGACKFDTPQGSGDGDPCFVEWRDRKSGLYTTNGAIFSVIKRSSQAEHLVAHPKPGTLPPPDLFIFGLLGSFKGYYPSYSEHIEADRNILTWAILKGHTRNTCGEVTLRSTDPRDPPLINFKYFDDDAHPRTPAAAKDVDAMIDAVDFVKRMLNRTGKVVKITAWPNLPLDDLSSPTQRKALEEFILNESWGHHACGTCKIGKDSLGTEQAVLDSRFRVHGLQGLRVVDASVFPKIPGFFIVTPVYMVSEKAAATILADQSQPSA